MILGNFWPRKFDFSRWPLESNYCQTEPGVSVLVQTQRAASATAEIVMLHGLEGAGDSGYVVSMAHAALEAGFTAHRFHMRSCGGTEHLCRTLYHGGLTSDLLSWLKQRKSKLPVFLVGFSLGGNVALKLAGELGERGPELIAGVCALSTPIDLAAGARRIGKLDNRLYERRFLKRMRRRLAATGRYEAARIKAPRSIYEIDDLITAPSFGFRGADHYYETQSSGRFLDQIRVPALVIQAKDDTFVPFEMFRHPAFKTNPHLELIATEHGGHLGFLSRSGRRFWLDETVVNWITSKVNSSRMSLLH